MSLHRLESTTASHTTEAIERGSRAAGQAIRRVEAAEGVEGDRQRSLQQELAEVDPRALGPFEGSAQILQGAKDLAAQLTLLGQHKDALVKLRALSLSCRHVDDKA